MCKRKFTIMAPRKHLVDQSDPTNHCAEEDKEKSSVVTYPPEAQEEQKKFHTNSADRVNENDKKSIFKSMQSSSVYITPYSNVVFSHPLSAFVMGCTVGTLLIFAIISLFVHPEKLECPPTL